MAVLRIRTYPDEVLKKKAGDVEDPADPALQQLVDDMAETMYSASGVGLAAPQVGVSRRLIVVDVGAAEEEQGGLIVLFNPEVVSTSGSMEIEEGCLSLPGFTTRVDRAETIAVSGMDREGKEITIQAEGLLSIALQHELDHLEGTLILDRTSFLKREFFKKQLKKKSLSKAG